MIHVPLDDVVDRFVRVVLLISNGSLAHRAIPQNQKIFENADFAEAVSTKSLSRENNGFFTHATENHFLERALIG